MPLILLPGVLGALVLLALLLYISSWQRPGNTPLVTASTAAPAKSLFSKIWHWTDPRTYGAIIVGATGKVVSGSLGRLLKAIEHWTQAALSHQIAALLHPITSYFHGLEATSREAWLQLGHLAEATHDALYHLRHTTVPELIRTAVAPVRAIAVQARTLATDAEGRLDTFKDALLTSLAAVGIGAFTTISQAVNALVHYVDRLHDQVWQVVTPKLDALFYTLVPQLTRELQDVAGDLYNTGVESLEQIRTRLRTVEDFLGKTLSDPLAWIIGILGTAAGLLALEGLLTRVAPNLFCRNTKGVTKRLCGFDETMLAALLAGTLGLLLALDVEKIAHEAQDAFGVVDGIVRDMARV